MFYHVIVYEICILDLSVSFSLKDLLFVYTQFCDFASVRIIIVEFITKSADLKIARTDI